MLDLGVGARAIERRLERGALHRRHRGVYAVGHRLGGLERDWMAAVLRNGDAVLSHRSAAQLIGLMPRRSSWLELTRPSGSRPRSGLVMHRADLRVDERALIDGIPSTGLSRTILDLAVILDRPSLERAMNEATVRRLTDAVSVVELLERHPRRRGAAVLRAILASGAERRGVTRSELELRFVAFLDAHAFPEPRLNAEVAAAGRFFEVDCLWQRQRLIVELDGRATHGTASAFESDRERDRALLLEGWRVTRVTWRALHERPNELAAELRRLLAPRSSPASPLAS